MNTDKTLIFTAGSDDLERFDVFLAKKISAISRSQMQKIIKNKLATVNKKFVTPHLKLRLGDVVEVQILADELKKDAPEIEIIKETDDYLVINKPAGVVVHPDAKHKSGTVVDFLKFKYPEIIKIGDDINRPGIVHRLDKEASGLMVIAKNYNSFDDLKSQFKKRTIEKEYYTLVYGTDLPINGEISTSLIRSKSGKMMADSKGFEKAKNALTLYSVVEKFVNFTLVKVITKTGRTHQIRVHFHSIGHSVVGDKLYTQKRINIKNSPRLFLHANYLKFSDIQGNIQEFSLPLAKDLDDFLKTLTKISAGTLGKNGLIAN